MRRLPPVAEQNARRAELVALRGQRALSADEQAESDRLDQALYMREYRRDRVERFGSRYPITGARKSFAQGAPA